MVAKQQAAKEFLEQVEPLSDRQVLWLNTVLQDLKAEADRLTSLAMKLRIRLRDERFPEPNEGTNRAECPLFKIAYKHKVKRYPQIEAVDPMVAEWTAYRASKSEPNLGREHIIRWKPELKLREFKALPEDERRIVEGCLSESIGSPEITVYPTASAVDNPPPQHD